MYETYITNLHLVHFFTLGISSPSLQQNRIGLIIKEKPPIAYKYLKRFPRMMSEEFDFLNS
jgi:hypothetical protein